MTSDRSFTQENAKERERLKVLVSQLSDEELEHSIEAGWTVAAILTHMAFWDHRAWLLIQKWKKEGIGPSAIDTDLVNEVIRLFFLAIPARKAAEIALSAAATIDEEIETLSSEMMADIEENGKTVNLRRAKHRRMHFEEIERALGKKIL
jgi:hypothetical protein